MSKTKLQDPKTPRYADTWELYRERRVLPLAGCLYGVPEGREQWKGGVAL